MVTVKQHSTGLDGAFEVGGGGAFVFVFGFVNGYMCAAGEWMDGWMDVSSSRLSLSSIEIKRMF